MNAQDLDLETRINQATLLMMTVPTPAERRFWYDALTRLVKERSQERIEEMEREKGLAG